MKALHFFILACVASISSLSLFAKSENDGFSIELIHPDSPKSPFYNPALNQRQLMTNALQRSINRANYFQSDTQLSMSIIPDIKGLYLTKISIGTRPSVVVVDTGSDLIWIQCQPCIHCFKQDTPIFNPKTSSTYKSISCNSKRCKNLPGNSCDPAKKTCLYFAKYNDQSFSYGDLASETLTFDDSSTNITRPKKLSVSNITFGCGKRNNLTINDLEPTGIIGLGASPFSLVSQIKSTFGHRFSYCLVPFGQLNVSSRLHFGKNALLSGKHVISTPLFLKPPKVFYFLNLVGITIGNKTLRFHNSSKNVHEGNIAIDSGTTITFLPTEIYMELKTIMRSEIKLKPLQSSKTQFLSLCYKGLRVSDVPSIRVQFQNAEVQLNAINTFVNVGGGIVCLAFAPTIHIPIFGNVAQTNFIVAYDLDKMSVSFKPTNCAKW